MADFRRQRAQFFNARRRGANRVEGKRRGEKSANRRRVFGSQSRGSEPRRASPNFQSARGFLDRCDVAKRHDTLFFRCGQRAKRVAKQRSSTRSNRKRIKRKRVVVARGKWRLARDQRGVFFATNRRQFARSFCVCARGSIAHRVASDNACSQLADAPFRRTQRFAEQQRFIQSRHFRRSTHDVWQQFHGAFQGAKRQWQQRALGQRTFQQRARRSFVARFQGRDTTASQHCIR